MAPTTPLHHDPMLADAPVVGPYPVLDPAVLTQRLGQGGMAAVYRGVHLRLKIPVAVKVLMPVAGDDSMRSLDRFNQEAEQAARLSHDNVVRVYDFGVTPGGLHYLVMELVDGETLEGRVRRRGRLTPAEAATAVQFAAAGLRHAHAERIVHRDIKPANILLSRTGQVKLADLGIAKAGDGAGVGMTQTQLVIGTPQYMAPELWRGSRHASPASDVYALGATLAFALGGEHLNGAGDVTEVMHRTLTEGFPDVRTRVRGCPAALADLVRRSTAKMPADRPSANDFIAALRTYLRDGAGAADLADPAAGGGAAAAAGLPTPGADVLTAIRQQLSTGRLAAGVRPPGAARPAAAAPWPPPRVGGLPTAAGLPSLGGMPSMGGLPRPGGVPPMAGMPRPAAPAWPGGPRPSRLVPPPRAGGASFPVTALAGCSPAGRPANTVAAAPSPTPTSGRRGSRWRLGWSYWLTAVVAAGLIFAVGLAESRRTPFVSALASHMAEASESEDPAGELRTGPLLSTGRAGESAQPLPIAFALTQLAAVALAVRAVAAVRPSSRLRGVLNGWFYTQLAGVALALVALGPAAAVGGGGAVRDVFVPFVIWTAMTAIADLVTGVLAGVVSGVAVAPDRPPAPRSWDVSPPPFGDD